jgi:hypothetical protein
VTVDYTDIVARFTDEVAASTLAEFIASVGIPCDVVETWDPQRLERFAIRVQRNRIPDMRRALDLKPVVTRLSPVGAQIVAGRLAREGVPCYVGGLHLDSPWGGDGDVPIRETTDGYAGVDCMVAVPAQFVRDALRIVKVAPVSDDELTKLALDRDAGWEGSA